MIFTPWYHLTLWIMTSLPNRHPADLAEELAFLEPREQFFTFLKFPPGVKVNVFSYLDPTIQQTLLKWLGDAEIADILNYMAPDDRTSFLEDFPDDLIKRLINLLTPEERAIALQLIGYKEDSVARIMTPYYVQIQPNWTVKEVFTHIQKYGRKAETLNFVYVVDAQNRLIDDLRIGQLLLSPETTLISDLMDYNFVALPTQSTIEEAIQVFEKYDRAALPITTENQVLVGIVTFDDILDKIEEYTTEDIQKFGGMEGLELSYIHTPLMELVRKRSTWLIILFFSEMLTASAMGYFDDEISKAVVLALFVPLIISSGGNSGSQAASLIIRALALGEIKIKDWWYVMRKEVFSGLMLGGLLGGIGFLRIIFWQELHLFDYGPYWPWISLSVAFSLVLIVLWGTLAGALIPIVLKKIGLDPATASAPFVATLVDVTGLVIYFTISAIFLKGKLL